jgi:hypothetical protein
MPSSLMEFLSMSTESSPPKTSPTKSPTKTPTKAPSSYPSRPPTALPTMYPSLLPTVVPTIYPTKNPTRYPSQDPTTAPSQGPTSAPSQDPTSEQSQDPTTAPSNSPTIVQSYLATSAPSDGPTSAPSKGPTNAPIESPSIVSTDEPTKSSTSNPTISPTKPQTDASTEPSAGTSTGTLAELTSHPSTLSPSLSPASTCQAQSGFFGFLTNNSYAVEFGYELETDPSVEGKVEDEVLPVLENNFNSFLLPVVFPSECGGSDGSTQDQFVVGITMRPDDRVLEEFGCRQIEVAGNICKVVVGELTLFTDGGRRLEVGDQILEALRSGMEDGSFVVAHASIERVSFVELGDIFAGLEGAEPSSIGNNDDGVMVGLVLAAAGAALLVIGAFVYRRRKNTGKEEEKATTLEPIIIPELASAYGSMQDSVVPDALFTPSDSSIFFDNEVLGEISPRSELGDVLEVASQCDSTLNAKIPDTVGISTPSASSFLSSFDDHATMEPSLPPAAEDSSVSDESSELTFPTN